MVLSGGDRQRRGWRICVLFLCLSAVFVAVSGGAAPAAAAVAAGQRRRRRRRLRRPVS